MLQQLYNTVDSIVVGNFLGSEALAAVGSSSSLIMLLISFSMGAAAGAGVIVSQFIGAQNKKGIHESVHTALAIALILGVVLPVSFCLRRFFAGWAHQKKSCLSPSLICGFILQA